MKLLFLSGVCIVSDYKTLIVQQAVNARHPGLWGPPAGHAKKGETLLETAVREVKEETGLKVKIDGLISCGIKLHSKNKSYIYAIYSSNLKGEPVVRSKDRKISGFKWATKNDIENDKYPLRDPVLKKILLKGLTRKISPIETFEIFS